MNIPSNPIRSAPGRFPRAVNAGMVLQGGRGHVFHALEVDSHGVRKAAGNTGRKSTGRAGESQGQGWLFD